MNNRSLSFLGGIKLANLKRNMIELVTDVKEGELVTKKFVTPIFIPMRTVYEAIDLVAELSKRKTAADEKELIEKLVSFIAEKVYNKQFTSEELFNGLHAPNGIQELYDQIYFIARGEQTEESKKYLETKN